MLYLSTKKNQGEVLSTEAAPHTSVGTLHTILYLFLFIIHHSAEIVR